MRHYSRYITLAGGLLAFFCFALPWKHIYSGAVLANARGWYITLLFTSSLIILLSGIYLLRQRRTVNPRLFPLALLMVFVGSIFGVVYFLQLFTAGINFITVSFVATIVIVATAIYVLSRHTSQSITSRVVLIFCCYVGLTCFLILFFGGSMNFDSNNRIDNTKYGAFITAIGYIIVLLDQLRLTKTENNLQTDNMQENETFSEGDEA